ncbi:hypothetical protein LguiA_016118 [Lonicera macranthoides]
MSARKNNYLYLGGERVNPLSSDHPLFEFDETDIWNSNNEISTEPKKSIPNSRSSKRPVKRTEAIERKPVTGTSLPVNIPDWSKILREEFKNRRREEDDDVCSDDGDVDKLPPHEYLARNRIASFSVHEGIGRTLKGRDLSRVRNAIWKKTGFED